jgi:hypothetical protein
MKDGDLATEHPSAFNTVVSQLWFVDLNIADEDKCINLFFSLLDLWDSLVVTISNTTQFTFKF